QSPKPKKSKKPLIITMVIIVILLLAAGATAAFAIVRNQPEIVAADAITNLISANNLKLSGKINLNQPLPLSSRCFEFREDIDSSSNNSSSVSESVEDNVCNTKIIPSVPAVTNLTIDLNDVAQSQATSSAATTVTMTFNEDTSKTVTLNISETFVKDGTIYLKIDGLKNTINTYLNIMDEDSSLSSGNSNYMAQTEQLLDGILRSIDGNWWAISIPEIIDHESSLTTINKNGLKDAYSCVVSELNNTFSKNNTIANIYRDNQFISIKDNKSNPSGTTKSGVSYNNYTINIKPNEFTTFYNQSIKQLDTSAFQTCLDKSSLLSNIKISDSLTNSNLKSSDVASVIARVPAISVGITGWDHQLVALSVHDQFKDSDGDPYGPTIDIDLNFDYPKDLNITAPSNAKSAIDLYDDIVESLMTLYSGTVILPQVSPSTINQS
ncbi:hypothetical protein IJ096_00945, partial [Candidatus Saccharibacteria bacterium]|nr:hypothetical protein [Candidatus Saccharibacteria bacterium]